MQNFIQKLKFSTVCATAATAAFVFLGFTPSTLAMDSLATDPIITTNLNISNEQQVRKIDDQTNKFINNCNSITSCLMSSKNNTKQNLQKEELELTFNTLFNETNSLITSIKTEQEKIKKSAEYLKTKIENPNFKDLFEEFDNNCEQAIKFFLIEYIRINQKNKISSINNNCDILFDTNSDFIHEFLVKYVENEYRNLLEKATCLIDIFDHKTIFKEKAKICKLIKENIRIYIDNFKNVDVNKLKSYLNNSDKKNYKELIKSIVETINKLDIKLTTIK